MIQVKYGKAEKLTDSRYLTTGWSRSRNCSNAGKSISIQAARNETRDPGHALSCNFKEAEPMPVDVCRCILVVCKQVHGHSCSIQNKACERVGTRKALEKLKSNEAEPSSGSGSPDHRTRASEQHADTPQAAEISIALARRRRRHGDAGQKCAKTWERARWILARRLCRQPDLGAQTTPSMGNLCCDPPGHRASALLRLSLHVDLPRPLAVRLVCSIHFLRLLRVSSRFSDVGSRRLQWAYCSAKRFAGPLAGSGSFGGECRGSLLATHTQV